MRPPRRNATNGWRRLCETTGHQSAVRAFTSTPPSFSSALIKAEAFSFPKPSATADSRFLLTTCNAGMGDYQRETLTRMFANYARDGLKGNPNVLSWLLGRPPTSVADFAARFASDPHGK